MNDNQLEESVANGVGKLSYLVLFCAKDGREVVGHLQCFVCESSALRIESVVLGDDGNGSIVRLRLEVQVNMGD